MSETKKDLYLTRKDFAKNLGISESTTYKRLIKAIEIAKVMEPNVVWTDQEGKGGTSTIRYKASLINYMNQKTPTINYVAKLNTAFDKEKQKTEMLTAKLKETIDIANKLQDEQITILTATSNTITTLEEKYQKLLNKHNSEIIELKQQLSSAIDLIPDKELNKLTSAQEKTDINNYEQINNDNPIHFEEQLMTLQENPILDAMTEKERIKLINELKEQITNQKNK